MAFISFILLVFGLVANAEDTTTAAILFVAAGLFGIADAIESNKS